jgi:very-short-patch-repair endonuclease
MSGDRYSKKLERAREYRRTPTPAEATLWRALRRKQLGGNKFKRQHPIGPFIVDFYCAAARLIVELDGSIHLKQKDYDRERERFLTERGNKTIRFTNKQVLEELVSVLAEITLAIEGNLE